jgi:hypothetical protein
MHLIIVLLAIQVFFLYLTLQARRNPEHRKQFFLYLFIDALLGGVFVYLMITGILS